MVGIARSKACYACKARRKKCDEKRPGCSLCSKRGIECRYNEDLNIVFVKPGQATRHNATQSRQESSSPATTTGSLSLISRSQSPESSPFDLCQHYVDTFERLHIRAGFLEDYLPQVSNLSPATGWLSAVYDLSLSDELVEDALSALALSSLERKLYDGDDFPQSRAAYSRTIRRLAARLSNTGAASHDTTLATVMLMTIYETQTATKSGMGGWLSHVKGTSQLVSLRGKSNVSSELAQRLYLGTRVTELIYSIGCRTRVEGARTIPKDKLKGLDYTYATLFEILTTMPAVLEQGDTIYYGVTTASTEELNRSASVVSYMCRDFETEMSSWYNHLLHEHADGFEELLYWQAPSVLYDKLPIDSPSRVFPISISFANLEVAQQLILYWTCLLMIHGFLHMLERRLKENGYDTITLYSTDLERRASGQKTHELATKITKSLEYFTDPNMGAGVVELLGLPINVIVGYWHNRNAKELAWLPVIFERLQAINPGCSAFLMGMAERGGGGPAFKNLISGHASTEPVTTSSESPPKTGSTPSAIQPERPSTLDDINFRRLCLEPGHMSRMAGQE